MAADLKHDDKAIRHLPGNVFRPGAEIFNYLCCAVSPITDEKARDFHEKTIG